MSEPAEIAQSADEVAPGVWHWQIRNSGIGGAVSSCHLFATDDGGVLVDPVQLDPPQLEKLPRPAAILLTSKGHQRSAWHYRREFAAPVWMPEGTVPPDEEPDHRYGDGDQLPGGFRAIAAPGPGPVHFILLREDGPGAVVAADLLGGDPSSGLRFGPLQYHDDPDATRDSVARLLDLPFTLLCLDHGAPFTDGKDAVRGLLAKSS
ncbi:MAG TPA: hypothetical protein VGC71_05645 [Gaiellales bacterium]